MARYTRAEILHLRDSPIIVYHTPPLPDWISPDAITASQTKSRATDRATTSRNPRTAEETGIEGATRSARGEKSEGFMLRGTRSLQEKEKVDRHSHEESMSRRRTERDRLEPSSEGLEPSYKPPKSRRALLEEERMTRRMDRTDSPRTSRRHEDVDDDETFNLTSDTPAWSANTKPSTDDAAGKTVDDFERWKQSMKKNDGSGDAGLPALPGHEEAGDSATNIEASPPRDVRPPPGFAGTMPIPPTNAIPAEKDAALLNGLFAAASVHGSKADSAAPLGLFSAPANGAAPVQSNASTKGMGSSKFSKFFSQSNAPQAEGKTFDKSQAPPGDLLDAMTASQNKSTSAKSDDAQGFERILAMLSSQSAPKAQHAPLSQSQRHNDAQHHQSQPQAYQLPEIHDRSMLSSSGLPGLSFPPLPGQQGRHDYGPPPRMDHSPVPPAAFGRSFNHASYSPDRQQMPSMRDGSTSIMNHHTQNQDFFASLMSNTHAPQAYNGQAPYPKDYPLQSPGPHHRHDSGGQRNATSPYETRSQYFPQHPQTSPQRHPAPPQRRDDHDFLNQLMAEQRIGSPPYNGATYGAPQGYPHLDRGTPAGFGNGSGSSRPGPGWAGAYDIDPRIPSASQYRA